MITCCDINLTNLASRTYKDDSETLNVYLTLCYYFQFSRLKSLLSLFKSSKELMFRLYLSRMQGGSRILERVQFYKAGSFSFFLLILPDFS